MLKLHFRLVKIRRISICCDSFEAYKWLQMKLENKCKISTHFFLKDGEAPARVVHSKREDFIFESLLVCTTSHHLSLVCHRAVECVNLSKTFQK